MMQLSGIATHRVLQLCLCALLALVCLLLGARLVWGVLQPAALPTLQFARPAMTPAALGFALYPHVAAAPLADRLQAASLDARLLGVMQVGERALASLAIKGEPERVFGVGDELASGVTLERIEARRVVVRERGDLRSLALVRLTADKAPIRVAAAHGKPPSEPAGGASLADWGRWEVTPEGDSGLRVERVAAALQGRIQAGDLVTAINGRGLTEWLAAGDALRQLARSEELHVSLVRGARRLEINLATEVALALVGRP